MKTGLEIQLPVPSRQALDRQTELDVYHVVKRDDASGDYRINYTPKAFDVDVTLAPDGTLSHTFSPYTYWNYSFPKGLLGDPPVFAPDPSRSEVQLRITSDLPVPLHAGMSLGTYRQDTESNRDFSFKDLTIQPGQNTLSLRDENLLRPLPNKFSFNGLELSIAPEDRARLEVGKTYKLHGEPYPTAPVIFNPGATIAIKIPAYLVFSLVNDLAHIHVRQAWVKLIVVNTIPLDFETTAYMADVEGNQLDDVRVTVEGRVAAGSLDSPSESYLTVSIATDDHFTHDCLTLYLTAPLTAQTGGFVLNHNHAVAVKAMRMILPEGIQIDLF